jgi:hypothetical protein
VRKGLIISIMVVVYIVIAGGIGYIVGMHVAYNTYGRPVVYDFWYQNGYVDGYYQGYYDDEAPPPAPTRGKPDYPPAP